MADLALDLTAAAVQPARSVGDPLPKIAPPTRLDIPANDERPHLPEQLAPDLPPAVGLMIVGAFAWTIGAYLITFWSDLRALEMVVVDIVYVAVYLGVPWIILKLEPKTGPTLTLAQFLNRGIVTFTGHLTGREALVQILTIPVALAVATTAMCLVAALA